MATAADQAVIAAAAFDCGTVGGDGAVQDGQVGLSCFYTAAKIGRVAVNRGVDESRRLASAGKNAAGENGGVIARDSRVGNGQGPSLQMPPPL